MSESIDEPAVGGELPVEASGPAAPPATKILRGPLGPAVRWLALPVLGEQALNACVTWNDSFLAGRISAEATGAIGIAGYIGWLLAMSFWLVDTGATAIVARAVGAGRAAEARRTVNQALVMAIALGVVGAVLTYRCAPWLAVALNMRGEAAQIAVRYLRIEALGDVGTAVAFALAACLRGAGDTRWPLIVLGGVNVVNCLASWVLTFGIGGWSGLGVDGIAWGTTIARLSGGGWLVLLLAGRKRQTESSVSRSPRPRQLLRLQLGAMRPDLPLIRRMLRIGLPAAADGIIAFSGHFLFMIVVTHVPSPFPPPILYAAHIVGIRIESLSYLPANAWAVAAATMVGQNLGAGQAERAKRSALMAARQAALLLAANGVLFFLAARPLYALLSNDPRVWECGVPALRCLALVQVPLALLIVLLGSLRGAGDTRGPMMITALCVLLVRVPLSALGGFVLKGGLVGAWIGMYADIVLRALLIGLRFRAGRWQRTVV